MLLSFDLLWSFDHICAYGCFGRDQLHSPSLQLPIYCCIDVGQCSTVPTLTCIAHCVMCVLPQAYVLAASRAALAACCLALSLSLFISKPFSAVHL